MTGSLPAVSRTAVGVAALRAAESRRPDRLFDDPYAAAFSEAGRSALPDAAPEGPPGGLGALFCPQVVIRTRLAAHGWQPSTVTRAELAAGYGRPSDDDATAGGFVTAVR
ncbi:class I SAM-dependent methyltransferase [Amycolatopsis sp. lyj-346]|uniref:class I SAM-dependent methyltransferase n=1 Tax=Amycolatopsis sp. lyj-346 TaxID=2789289 RepID=UPI00397ADD49